MEITLGRPPKGALSSYPKKIVTAIYKLRDRRPGWGAGDVLYELRQNHGYSDQQLPSIATVNRYFKEAGLIKTRVPRNSLPKDAPPKTVRYCHDIWEMDAQGPVMVEGLGYVAMINIKDTKSKAHIMGFPVIVKSKHHQPKTIYYQWALRFAFIEWGLPKLIQVDKDSVFYPNTAKSAFPTLLHLWLLALGVQLDFIKFPPPIKNAMVERSHQTMQRQVLQGQSYKCWKDLFKFCNQRRRLKNKAQTNPYIKKKPPLVKYPKAKENKRRYTIDTEWQLLDLKRVCKYLARCKWYRWLSKDKTFSLGSKTYYVKEAKPLSQLSIHFCNRAKKLVCQDGKEQIIQKLPLKGLSPEKLMGATQKEISKKKRSIEFHRNCAI